jgi:penicillin-binding protein 1C
VSWKRRALSAGGVVAVAILAVVAVAIGRTRLEDPAPTVLLVDRDGAFLAEIGVTDDLGSGYWPLREVPWRVAAATIAVEDHRFARHPGVDPRSVGRAVVQDVRAGEVVSGASTLAMQVARMQDPGDRSVPNKLLEGTTAVLLTGTYGRDAVLAQYLRFAPYGHGIHGIGYAARRYLDKPVDDLSWAEIAFLCAIPQSPSRMDPFTPKGKGLAVARARRILALLEARGVVTADEHALADGELDGLVVPDRLDRPISALHAILRISRDLDDPDVRRALPSPIVRANLDLALQNRVAAHVHDAVAGWQAKGAGNAAVIVLDVHTGAVLASVGSAAYFDPDHAGAIDYTQVRRNAGSTLKPFLYAAALDRGIIRPDSVLDDLNRGPEGITNADQGYLGPLLPRIALANSRNVPAVELISRLGVNEQWDILRRLGLHRDESPSEAYGVGLAIGALPVRLEDLAGAYLALAGDGRERTPAWYGEPGEPGDRVFTAASSRTIAQWLSDPVARLPTFTRMGPSEYPFPVAVKTGTSSDWRDAWTVAWSDRVLVAVWIGDPGNTPMAHVSGFGSAAALAQAVILDVHADEADGLSGGSFPPPESTVPVRLCALTGHVATAACDHVVTEYFPASEAPTRPCEAHVTLKVDGVERTYVDLPPRYASWQARQGLPRPPGARMTLDDGGRTVAIVSPRDGDRVLHDVDTPAATDTLALQAVVDPPVPQVVWYVDGEPFATVDYPYETRWPLEVGAHRFEARVPFTDARSRSVRVITQ